MQQESLAAKTSKRLRVMITPAAKRSAPVEELAEGQDVGAPAKVARLVPKPQPSAAACTAGATSASQALQYKRAPEADAPCKVTFVHVTKHLARVAQARPMVWQANSVAATPAVKELKPGDGVILSLSTTGKETAEDYKTHIAPRLPPTTRATQHSLRADSKVICFAVAKVKALDRSEVCNGSAAAAETGTWVELEPGSLVWIHMPWEQLVDDFGLPDKASTSSRTEKQTNIAAAVRYYAAEVAALATTAPAQGGIGANGHRRVGRLAPCPTGHFLRKLEDIGAAAGQPAAAADDGAAAGGKQQAYDGSNAHDDDSGDDGEGGGHEQQPGAAAAAAVARGGVGAVGGAAAAAAPAPLPARPARAVAAGVDAAAAGAGAAGAGPSNAVAALAPPLSPQLAAEEEKMQRVMQGMNVCFQSKDDEKKELTRMLTAAREQAAAATTQRDAEATARAAAEKGRNAAAAQAQAAARARAEVLRQLDAEKGLRANAEKQHAEALAQMASELAVVRQQRDDAVAAAQRSEEATAQARVERDAYKSLYDTLVAFVEKKTLP